MEQSINLLINRMVKILHHNKPSIFLFGSVVLDDFKLGWSDIDIICLIEKGLDDKQADELVELRQNLVKEFPSNMYFRLFEGGILPLDLVQNNTDSKVVYWGTSGQRITDKYEIDPFARIELHENGRLLFGEDCRRFIPYPTREEIVGAISNHYNTIRNYGTSGAGWFLDIARCLYTLKTNKVISKTSAGEWAIQEKLCPDAEIMRKIIEIRKNPLVYVKSDGIKKWLNTLGPFIQGFADVLQRELIKELEQRHSQRHLIG